MLCKHWHRRVAEQKSEGAAILLVEQNVRFTLSRAERYTALARGEVVDAGHAGDVDAGSCIADHLSV